MGDVLTFFKRKSERQSMLFFLTRFAKNDSGASAIEYAMLVALLAMGIIVSITTLGLNTRTPFSVIADKIQG